MGDTAGALFDVRTGKATLRNDGRPWSIYTDGDMAHTVRNPYTTIPVRGSHIGEFGATLTREMGGKERIDAATKIYNSPNIRTTGYDGRSDIVAYNGLMRNAKMMHEYQD